LSSVLSCIIAGAIPRSLKIPKNVIITIATATTPKSDGDNNRDSMAVIIKEIRIPAYLAIAVYVTPDINVLFRVIF
jgi:hypothetical protein